jgi:hypothetical protein
VVASAKENVLTREAELIATHELYWPHRRAGPEVLNSPLGPAVVLTREAELMIATIGCAAPPPRWHRSIEFATGPNRAGTLDIGNRHRVASRTETLLS